MVVNQPHFLLFTDAHLSKSRACAISDQGFGRWHFVLERLDGPERLEAADSESDVHRDRLALLAVVRGLEALEQPSQVTLVTTSRYVSRGLRYGLNEWREAEYTWEHFGMQKPIRNADLWQRIDGAMHFHQVTCRLLQSPLAQSMVETAAELDEITMIANPLDVAFEASENRGSEYQTAAGLACRVPVSGAIQRVDSAHGSVGANQKPALRQPIAAESGLVKPSFDASALADAQQLSLVREGSEMVSNQTAVGTGQIVLPELRLITEVPYAIRRPRISITFPALRFRWMELAMRWVRWWRTRFTRTFWRSAIQATLQRNSRTNSGAVIAPT